MNEPKSRRQFLADVSRGTLAATIGTTLASELGLVPAAFGVTDGPEALRFGELESLVGFMQDTPLDKLQPLMLVKLRQGVPLQRLLAAGVLANARSFGGEDYIGFHTLMALSPALSMSARMPETQTALPVFKVLYRNTNRIQEHGGREKEVLHPVAADSGMPVGTVEHLRALVHAKDVAGSERLFAGMVRKDAEAAFNALLEIVQENTEVHRTVLPFRAWDLLNVVGREHAETMLRQSLRYCLNSEKHRRAEWEQHGHVLTKLLDEHKLLGRDPGTRTVEDGFVEELCRAIFSGTPEQAAGAVAAALAEDMDPAAVGEALSLAANQLVLRDQGRPPAQESPGKPPGSTHGDSIGVHASDSANAWRKMSLVSRGRNVHACLILGAWQIAGDRVDRGGDFLNWEPLPAGGWYKRTYKDITEPAKLIAALDDAVRQNLQGHASAVVQRCAELGHEAGPVFDKLLTYAVSEDGALHAEKYYQTVWDDFHATRPAFRWRHLIGLARVTASEYGRPAPGQAEARELLRVV